MSVNLEVENGNVSTGVFVGKAEFQELTEAVDDASSSDASAGACSITGTCSTNRAQGGFVVHPPIDGYAGCAVGSTLVARLNTKMVSIQELLEKGGKQWVFAAHRPLLISNFIISGASSIVQLVRQQTELMRVVLDNDKEIICSPDYQLLTIEGIWCKAVDLDEDVLLEAFDTQENRFHQIQFTEKLDYVEDAYCLAVEHYGNFALAAGVYARGFKGARV